MRSACSPPVPCGTVRHVGRGLVIALTVVATCAVSVLAASAEPSSGPGPQMRAEMYDAVLVDAYSPIQVLARICVRPRRPRRCLPLGYQVRHAIDAGVPVEIRWVHRMWPHAGDYWVLSPVRSTDRHASFTYAWTDPLSGCRGGGRKRFRREGGAWMSDGGSAYAGCPAGRPAPQRRLRGR